MHWPAALMQDRKKGWGAVLRHARDLRHAATLRKKTDARDAALPDIKRREGHFAKGRRYVYNKRRRSKICAGAYFAPKSDMKRWLKARIPAVG